MGQMVADRAKAEMIGVLEKAGRGRPADHKNFIRNLRELRDLPFEYRASAHDERALVTAAEPTGVSARQNCSGNHGLAILPRVAQAVLQSLK